MVTGFARPRVVLSRCLELEKVRYDGEKIAYGFVRELEPFVDLVPICPEVEIGLGVPRDPIRLVEEARGIRLVQPSAGQDLTTEMEAFADGFLGSVTSVDGFLLKNRSPSCGISDVKRYRHDGELSSSGRGAGLFGEAVLDRFGHLAVADEGKLRDARIREHFLTKLFALAALREVKEAGSVRDLTAFHARYKLLLMAYSQNGLSGLSRLVSEGSQKPFAELVTEYRTEFGAVLRQPPPPASIVNVLDDAAGYLKALVGRREKTVFFPEALMSVSDSRKGPQP
jgi:uncharacterized protein YbbK (DUF523 family)/uncharacterized protein YbgA (DUF1722 family)